jgi:hypothetical protein
LFPHLPLFHCPCHLEQPVRQGGLAVVNVGNDAKIPQTAHRGISHGGIR